MKPVVPANASAAVAATIRAADVRSIMRCLGPLVTKSKIRFPREFKHCILRKTQFLRYYSVREPN